MYILAHTEAFKDNEKKVTCQKIELHEFSANEVYYKN
jgi:hypothetical protein